VPKDAPFGHCPGCLVELGFGPMPEDATVAAPSSGNRRFGEYELLEQIGRGGMGVVYKARQVSLKRLVALKMLGPHASAFPGLADRLRLEAEVAGSLRHPQIVTIYDVGEHEGQPFFTMELIEGLSLERFITTQGFHLKTSQESPPVGRNGAEAQAARVMIQIARAVDHAHQHGVLHRDLKPANVLLDAQGLPHLTDFGLAKAIGRVGSTGTASGAILGTPAYMAPEQASGATKHTTVAADVYSLGAILYEMLTGRPPFRAETPLETLRCVVEEPPKPPSTFNRNLDNDLATICVKCLEKDPRQRYLSAAALADDLERWMRGEPIEARIVGKLERAWRWCLREPLIAGMVAAIALLLIAATTFALIAYRRAQSNFEQEQAQREAQVAKLRERISREWEDDNLRFIHLDAEELGILSDRPFQRDVGEAVIRLGVQLPGKDRSDAQLRITQGHPALAEYLRTNLAPYEVLFDVFLYKNSSNAADGVVRGEVDVMQLSPAGYVEARRRNASLIPLVAQTVGGQTNLHGALFVNTNARIDRLESLRGHSFAFAELDSAISHLLPKLTLLDAGLHARDLSASTNTRPWHAISLVRKGVFDAGAAEFDEVQKLVAFGAPLRILREVRSPGAPWVASTKLESAVRAAVQRSLLSLTNSDILAGISRGLTGFHSVSAGDYDELEGQMDRARLFDQAP
jgi:ABC-type phosphate/phosphonate transport system substrate-binding protein